MKKLMPILKTNRAITLVEIIVTLIVMGALAAVAVPSFTSMIQQSQAREGQNNLMQIYLAQKNRIARGLAPYVSPNAYDTDTDGINAALGLSLTVRTAGAGYTCGTGSGTDFECHVGGGSEAWWGDINQGPIVPGVNPVMQCNRVGSVGDCF